jgi:hypothetical protein
MPDVTREKSVLSAREKAYVFIPLGIYLLYVLYLVFFSSEPFLNLVRQGLVDRSERSGETNREAPSDDDSSSGD